jgi:response regulator RpfG family c-di-GMP phosphodiesterase
MTLFKILLVDDSRGIRKALSRSLRDDRIELLDADSATAALGILEKQTVDLIIADEHMPGLSGTDLLRLVKERFPETIRFMLTGATDIDVAKDAINRGEVERFFTKPWDDAELRRAVKHALSRLYNERKESAEVFLGRIGDSGTLG